MHNRSIKGTIKSVWKVSNNCFPQILSKLGNWEVNNLIMKLGMSGSLSGDGEQEDWGSKPPQANSLRDPILKTNKQTNHKKRAGGVAQGVGPEFKPQYRKKKN
jgi:hypothetical protein